MSEHDSPEHSTADGRWNGDTAARRRGVSPRGLMAAVLAVVAMAVLALVLLLPDGANDGVELVGFTAESTETVSFAGSFPAGDSVLHNPLSLATDGELIYVAEADAARIAIFSPNGGSRGEIVIPAASETSTAYPADVAYVGDGTLAVVDTAGSRVVLVDTEPGAADPVSGVVGVDDPSTAPVSPTAVAVAGGRLLVADAMSGAILRYDLTGRYLDRIGENLEPRLGVIGGLGAMDDRLYVADSAAGRVLVLDAETGDQRRVLDRIMDLPRGAVEGNGGRVYVADRFAGLIEVFDADGRDVERFGDGARTGVVLEMPTDVLWWEETARLYVVDAVAGRIGVYNVRGQVGE